MPDFAYRAKTTSGAVTQGVLKASSHREALSQLTQQRLFPLEVRDQSARSLPFGIKLGHKRRVRTEVVADTLTQLADLLINGVTLLESLRILAEQSPDKRMAEILLEVHNAVADGVNLDEAMADHPQVFSHLAVSMVRAGLEGAFLEDALERVSGFLQKQDEVRAKIIGAMTYPAVLAVVGVAVTIALVTFIVPMFEPFFERLEQSGVGLPTITVVLLAVSHGLVKYGVFAAAAVTGLVILVKKLLASERGRRWTDTWKLRLPVLGPIFHDAAVSRFCRILGTLLRNGVPILKSLSISSASAGNILLQETILASADNISSGNLLSQPLAASGLIPPQVMAMIRIAEESNTLDQVLVKIANRMDQRIERRLDTVVRLVEPIMLLTVGTMVAFIIIGVLLPVFDINSAID